MQCIVPIVLTDINTKQAFYADPSSKPAVLDVDPTDIPRILRQRPRWVLWKLVWKPDNKHGGKWTKIPFQVNGRAAKSNDPKTWMTCEKALEAYNRGGWDGIGFVLGNGFVGIDLDDVRNPNTGEITAPWAAEMMDSAGTYAEVSPSGTGIKLFGLGNWDGEWHKKPHPSGTGEIEVYDNNRFFCVTGQAANDGDFTDIQPTLDELVNLSPAVVKPPVPDAGDNTATLPSDDEIVARAREGRNGHKFSRLWDGDASDYPSQSEAELALCGIIAFWCGHDPARIDRLFRQSKLMREKWDEPRGELTYGEMTVAKALEGKTEFYDPTQGTERPPDQTRPVLAARNTNNPWPKCWLGSGLLSNSGMIRPKPHTPQSANRVTQSGLKGSNSIS